VTAKQVATLDLLSGGRTLLGVGVGWMREEYDALGVSFERRGARLDEYVDAIRILWTGNEASMEGEFVRFAGVVCRPRPVQERLPVIIGGHSKAAARRAGRLGDGFFPSRVGKELPALVEIVQSTAREFGRDPDSIEVTVGGVGCVGRNALDNIKRFEDMGVHRITLPPLAGDPDAIADALFRYRDDIMSSFR